jgi:hypothetical protein
MKLHRSPLLSVQILSTINIEVAKYPNEFSFELIDPEKVFGQMFNVGHGQSRDPLHVAA